MPPAFRTPALAYLRTSSATNVGADKDSEQRQRAAVVAYARRAGLEIVGEHYDAAVSGADPLDARTGFTNLLAHAEVAGVHVILVEAASRFARDFMVQETGHAMLARMGVMLVAADDPDAFTADTPTAALIRQLLGAVSQFERATLVAKLKAARDRRSAAPGRQIEGRPGHAAASPDLVRHARRLARRSPRDGSERSLRDIAAKLEQLGYVTAQGRRFGPGQVRRLLAARAASDRTSQALEEPGATSLADLCASSCPSGKRQLLERRSRRMALSSECASDSETESSVSATNPGVAPTISLLRARRQS